MSSGIPPLSLLISLFALVIIGVGILVFPTPVPADRLTPAQENLLVIGDWMVKVSVGAILGLGGSRLASTGTRGKGDPGPAANCGAAR